MEENGVNSTRGGTRLEFKKKIKNFNSKSDKTKKFSCIVKSLNQNLMRCTFFNSETDVL